MAAFQNGVYAPGVPCAHALMQCIADLHGGQDDWSSCSFRASEGECISYSSDLQAKQRPVWDPIAGLEGIAAVLGMDYAGRFTEQRFIAWWRRMALEQPVGLTRSMSAALAVGIWPVVPRPHPPVGDATVAPLIIGNLHDAQTPYHNAQKMSAAFPSGRMLTWQGYGHGLQVPHNIKAVVQRYEEEMRTGAPPSYNNEVAKLLCVRVALKYLKDGALPRDYVCKAASPPMTGKVLTHAAEKVLV